MFFIQWNIFYPFSLIIIMYSFHIHMTSCKMLLFFIYFDDYTRRRWVIVFMTKNKIKTTYHKNNSMLKFTYMTSWNRLLSFYSSYFHSYLSFLSESTRKYSSVFVIHNWLVVNGTKEYSRYHLLIYINILLMTVMPRGNI